MNKMALCDSGYWIGLLDSRDQFNEKSLAIQDMIRATQIGFPTWFQKENRKNAPQRNQAGKKN